MTAKTICKVLTFVTGIIMGISIVLFGTQVKSQENDLQTLIKNYINCFPFCLLVQNTNYQ